MKKAGYFLLILMAFAVAANAQGVKVGDKLDNFSMPDTDMATKTLEQVKGTKGTALIFLSAQCPVVKGYVGRINELAAAYQAKGIAFVGVNSNHTEAPSWVKSNVAEYGYKFPVLIDKDNVFADKLGAHSTPEVFFLDGSNKLIYHGGIDNDKSGRNVTDPYLRTAFDAFIAGKPIARSTTVAFGCTIKRLGD